MELKEYKPDRIVSSLKPIISETIMAINPANIPAIPT